jgi:tRNA-dihydrouridine synthase B
MTMRHLILAPLRGFTDAVFRNVFQRHFQGLTEAVAPFVTSTKGRRVNPSHLRDLVPSDNSGVPVIPQILSNDTGAFIRLAKTLVDEGYGEINWNLGCPFPMVAKKKRGAGLLPYPDLIDRFLERICSVSAIRLSVKTRLGRFSAAEMKHLIPVFNRYPLARVIIHPRTGVQMYTGSVDLDAFAESQAGIDHPVVYNGDIVSPDTFRLLEERFPDVSGWMLGRGLIAKPFLAEMIQGGTSSIPGRIARFRSFHDDLVDGYGDALCGPAHVMDRMKGFWRYFADGFVDGQLILKRVRKAGSLERYRKMVASFLDEQGDGGFPIPNH